MSRATVLFLGVCLAGLVVTASSVAAASQSDVTPGNTQPTFAAWLDEVRTEAAARGVRQDILDAAFANIEEPLPIAIERDRTQPESKLSLERYVSRLLTTKTVAAGREALERHRTRLAAVADRYGVPPPVLVSIWGIESNFGRFTGVRPTIAVLVSLAWDPRRSRFFRGELFDALEILNRGDIDLAQMRGSWAGAMGQPQFMPSSYLEFAQDFDGDGRRDIWSSPADVFASIANYLTGHGWKSGERWGREVRVSPDAARRIAETVPRRDGSCVAARDMTVALPLERWQQLGVRLPGGGALPAAAIEGSLVAGAQRKFLVYQNYDALLAYNCAHSYAVTVGLLADLVGSVPASSPGTRPPAARGR